MKIILYRHGTSDHNVTNTHDCNILSRSLLTENGYKTLRTNTLGLVDYIKKKYGGIRFGDIYSSPLVRCVMTSSYVTGILYDNEMLYDDFQVIVDSKLMEVNMGDLNGLVTNDNGWDFSNGREYNGETEKDVYNRIEKFYKSKTYKNKHDFIVFSHGEPIRELFRYITGEEYKPKRGSCVFIDTKKMIIKKFETYDKSY